MTAIDVDPDVAPLTPIEIMVAEHPLTVRQLEAYAAGLVEGEQAVLERLQERLRSARAVIDALLDDAMERPFLEIQCPVCLYAGRVEDVLEHARRPHTCWTDHYGPDGERIA